MAQKRKGKSRNKVPVINIIVYIIIGCAVLVLFGSGLLRFNEMLDKGKTTIITSSTLTDVIDIEELSTAQFTYNGIAQVYKNAEATEASCNIRYDAIVKAGVDLSQVVFEIDSAKTDDPKIYVSLPAIKITADIVDDQSISFIPSDYDIELKEAIACCETDAMNEAQETGELLSIAEENVKSTIEALLKPILQENGYSIVWKN